MRRLRALLTFIFICVSGTLFSQDRFFGYIDFNGTLKLMPEYVEAQASLEKTQADYRDEIDRSKREFERKYIEFMLEQDHLSSSIVAKRQRELQLMMDNNVQFRDNVQSELEAKRQELLVPIKKKLMEAVAKVCTDEKLDYVIDVGTGTYLYINGDKGVDISSQVYRILKIEYKPAVNEESGQAVLK